MVELTGFVHDLVGGLHGSVLATDRDLRIIAVNDQWERDLHTPRDQALGRAYFEISPSSEQWRGAFERCLGGEPIKTDRIRVPRAKGGSAWLQSSLIPWRDEDGVIGGLLLINQLLGADEGADDTSLAADRLDDAVALAGVHVWEMNHQTRRMWGAGATDTFFQGAISYNDLNEGGLINAVHPDDRERVAALWAAQSERSEDQCAEYSLNLPDRRVWVSAAMRTIMGADGEPGRVLGVMQNITDRKLAELAVVEANKALTDSQGAIKNLLDNADQGFLTVAPDLRVGDQCSAACETILGQAPAGKVLLDLLFEDHNDAATSMRFMLESIFRDGSDFARELKLELLPKEFILGDRFVRAGYKFLADSGQLMLIFTDVTETRLLTLEVERERRRLEMIVLAVTDGEAFGALVADYRAFLDEELARLILRFDDPAAPGELYRRLHTFKGLLAQFSFPSSPTALHEAEDVLASRPAWTARDAGKALGPAGLRVAFEHDLASLAEALGADFVPSRHLVLSQSQLQAMEKVARAVLAGNEGRAISPPLRLLLQTLTDLGRLDVKSAISMHSRGALGLAERLEKQLAPIVIKGDDVALAPEPYNEFFRTLVHVFRNAVDHGIETPDERMAAGKPIDGQITCDVRDQGDYVEILISDDGHGIDRRALEDKLTASGEDRRSAEALSLQDLVFRDGLSSRDTASEVSGRGVGMAAVKSALDELGGAVSVTTQQGLGSQFRFRLPTGESAATGENDVKLLRTVP